MHDQPPVCIGSQRLPGPHPRLLLFLCAFLSPLASLPAETLEFPLPLTKAPQAQLGKEETVTQVFPALESDIPSVVRWLPDSGLSGQVFQVSCLHLLPTFRLFSDTRVSMW